MAVLILRVALAASWYTFIGFREQNYSMECNFILICKA